jgi:hypothetical protein
MTSKPVDPVHEPDQGIKRDPTAFPKLKDERFRDQFLRSTHAVARTQKMIHVFGKNYTPTTVSVALNGESPAELPPDHTMLFNKRAAPLRGEDVSPVVKSAHDNDTDLSKSPSTLGTTMDDDESKHTKNTLILAMPVFDPNDLVGHTFLRNSGNDDGQRFRVRIVEALNKHYNATVNDPRHIQFRVSINDYQYEELLSYSDIVNYINNNEQEENNRTWNFKKITAHEGPLTPNDPSYNGSMWDIMVEWKNGEITSEPLSVIAAADPVVCTLYARDHNLLQLEGWKSFACIARCEKKMLRMVNQAKFCSYRWTPGIASITFLLTSTQPIS